MRLILIGFMGVGKSTIGKELAEILNCKHLDLDTVIENKLNSTISDLFKKYGENKFRELERFWLESISKYNNAVISTGGGTPCYSNNMKFLLESGTTIYLKCSPKLLVKRLRNKKNKRPIIRKLKNDKLLTFINQNLKEREKFYNKAKLIIQIENLEIKELLRQINTLILT